MDRTSPFRKPLTDVQLERRDFMKGLLASGAFLTLAGFSKPLAAMAQTPVTDWAPFSGELAEDQTIRIPTSEPTTMDPAVSYGDSELAIFFNIFESLTGVDQRTGEVVPRLAESWEASEDATVFTFKIRQNLAWSDGTPINAHDFVYSWQRVLDPNTASEYMSALYPIKNGQAISEGSMALTDLGVAAVDDYTLEVTMEGPTAYFPLLATTWTYCPVPRHVVEDKGLEWVEGGNLVGSGPFTMESWDHDQEIVLVPNPNYYGEAPTIQRAVYRIYDDPTAQAFPSFENDEIDYAAPTGPDLARIRESEELMQFALTFPLSQTYFIVADTKNPPTDSIAFRQALYKTVDRETLSNDVFKGEFLPAYTLLPPDIPGNNPDAAMSVGTEEALALLAENNIDPASISIELAYRNTSVWTTVAQYLQAQWQEQLGIAITLTPIEDNTYIDWRAARDTQPFNLYSGTWGSDFADASNWFNQNWHSSADHYRDHWNNTEFDAIIEAAATNTNFDERNAQWAEAEALFIQEAPVIPFMRAQALRMVKPWVKDLFFQPLLSVVHLRTVKIEAH
ncbi:MAG: peptide ABC transporter substrate-binding protein [Thermomicrobiales bacterium]|nr:peptide ABC transporter substrate-binding protein [Thermomicrobiales bacterium]